MGRSFELFLLILTFFLLISFNKGLSFKKISYPQNFHPQVIIEKVEYSVYKRENLEWKLKAKEIWQNIKGDLWGREILLINVKKGVRIKGKEGFYFARRNEFLLRKGVILKTQDNRTVSTEELKFFPDRGIVVSNKKVIVKEKRMVMKGRGFIYFVDTGDLRIKEKANVKLKF